MEKYIIIIKKNAAFVEPKDGWYEETREKKGNGKMN